MPTTYREGKLSGLNTAIGNVGKVYLQKMLEEQAQKRKIKQTIEQSVLEAALKDQRLKPGADLSGLDTSQGMQGILGQIPRMFERKPVEPTTSISITERPFSERIKAQGILGMKPKDFAEQGMAQKTGGWFGNWGPGSKWKISPEGLAMQEEAQSILGGPKITTRKTYKGDVVDTTAEVEKTVEERYAELEAQGYEEDEIYKMLAEEGYQ